MPPITDEAIRILAAIRELKLLAPEAYIALLREADRLRRERRASHLGRVHVEMALDRLAEMLLGE